MADGSGKPETIVREADAAAAEAASEARAEVLERAGVEVSGPRHSRASRQVKAGQAWHEFEVNVWLTDINSVEFGIYRHSRNKAKSRQFTSDMDIYAEVIENGQRTGLIGYREELWKKSAGMERRLVMKLFNEGLNWRASMDFMVARSLQQTIGARGVPVVSYAMNIGDHEFVVHLERSANKWPLLPENFSFFMMDNGEPRFFRLRRALINLGGDYTLLDERDRVIAHLDGRLFTLTGFWRGRIKTEYASARLVMVLQMFCGMLIFNRGARRHVKALYREVMAGKHVPKLQRQESDLYMNPRRVR
ncbi:MAG: hypothetical protein SFW09_09895 [Hyphomicrobiaceae bacterium]|nr:hypothetical protein [Hyphomicrobiaceae bacterium]